LQITAGGDKVLGGLLYGCPVERADVRVTTHTRGRSIWYGEKSKVLPYIRINRHGTDDAVGKIGHVAGAHGIGNRELSLGCPLGLTHALIVAEQKELVL